MQYFNLNRFVEAQDRFSEYETAKQEIYDGEKVSHWIWYIFPQIKGLGFSGMSQTYAIESLFEACAYLQHPVLGARLYEISEVLYNRNDGCDIERVMGSSVDAIKLRSCMTLFELVAPDCIFSRILDHFFDGKRDAATLKILGDDPKWLLGKDAFCQHGVNRPSVRAFLEGIDTDGYSSDQLLATNLDLVCKGHSMVKLCMNHLVGHNDIFGNYRPHDVEVKLTAYMYNIFDEIIAKTDKDFATPEVTQIKMIYSKIDNGEIEYCLEVAELFDKIVEFIKTNPTLRPILENYIQYYTLVK